MATIPPWIITPDAAGRYVQGYSLGIDVASKRAAQRVQQQQMALEQQNMAQRQQANAEIAARQAIQMQLDEQFRKAQLAADSARLAQAAQQAQLAREQAATLAGNRLALDEKIAFNKPPTLSPESRLFNEADALESQAKQAEQSGNVEAASKLRSRASILTANAAPSGMEITTTPEGGMTFRQGRGLGGSNQTMQNKTTDIKLAAIDLGKNFSEAEKLINPATIGPGGVIARTLIDEGPIGLAFPALVNEKRIDLNTMLKFMGQETVKALKSDGNISEREASILRDIAPSTGFRETPASARSKIKSMRKLVYDRARTRIMDSGQQIPPQMMYPSEARQYITTRNDLDANQKRALAIQLMEQSPYK